MWFRTILRGRSTAGGSQAGNSNGAAISLTPRALRQLDRLRLNTGPLLPGLAAGSRPSLKRKPAADFREHRQYTPGDDIRYVDWKASGRQEHIFIKQGELEKDAFIYLLLDCSASMAWGEPLKSLAALRLAQALCYLALAHGDRLLVLPVTDARMDYTLPPLGPIRGKGQVPLLIQYLQAIRFQGQVDLGQAMASLGRRKLSRGGLALVVSDLLGVKDLPKGLAALPMPSWNVVVCHLLHPAEINPALDGDFEMHDIETGQKKNYAITPRALNIYRQRFQAWHSQLASACSERKAVYSLIPANWSLEDEIIPQLRGVQVVKPL